MKIYYYHGTFYQWHSPNTFWMFMCAWPRITQRYKLNTHWYEIVPSTWLRLECSFSFNAVGSMSPFFKVNNWKASIQHFLETYSLWLSLCLLRNRIFVIQEVTYMYQLHRIGTSTEIFSNPLLFSFFLYLCPPHMTRKYLLLSMLFSNQRTCREGRKSLLNSDTLPSSFQ